MEDNSHRILKFSLKLFLLHTGNLFNSRWKHVNPIGNKIEYHTGFFMYPVRHIFFLSKTR